MCSAVACKMQIKTIIESYSLAWFTNYVIEKFATSPVIKTTMKPYGLSSFLPSPAIT